MSVGGVEKYGADAMRFSLADAGDSLEDANFAEDTAFNIILRLFAQKEWIKVLNRLWQIFREGKRIKELKLLMKERAF